MLVLLSQHRGAISVIYEGPGVVRSGAFAMSEDHSTLTIRVSEATQGTFLSRVGLVTTGT